MLNYKDHAALCRRIFEEVTSVLTDCGQPGAVAVLSDLFHEDLTFQARLPSNKVHLVSLARRGASLIEARYGRQAMIDALEAFILADGMDEETAEGITLFYMTKVREHRRLLRLISHLPFPVLRRRRAELGGIKLHHLGHHVEAEELWALLEEADRQAVRLNCYCRLVDLGRVCLALGVAAFIPTGPCRLSELLHAPIGAHVMAGLAFGEAWCEATEAPLPGAAIC